MKDAKIHVSIYNIQHYQIICNIIFKGVPKVAITDVLNKRVKYLIGEVVLSVWLCADGSSFICFVGKIDG